MRRLGATQEHATTKDTKNTEGDQKSGFFFVAFVLFVVNRGFHFRMERVAGQWSVVLYRR